MMTAVQGRERVKDESATSGRGRRHDTTAAITSSANGMIAVIFVPIAQPLISPLTMSQPRVEGGPAGASTRRHGDTEEEGEEVSLGRGSSTGARASPSTNSPSSVDPSPCLRVSVLIR